LRKPRAAQRTIASYEVRTVETFTNPLASLIGHASAARAPAVANNADICALEPDREPNA
jgi:hypothetical protein